MRGGPHSFKDLADLPKASKQLVTNLTFIFLSLAGASEGILLTGFATFMAKFIESQFSIKASSSALLVGKYSFMSFMALNSKRSRPVEVFVDISSQTRTASSETLPLRTSLTIMKFLK